MRALLVPALATMLSTAAQAEPVAAPPPAFAQCASCHSVMPGRHVFGPSLAGVSGRKAGSVEGYAYSEALRASRLTWDAATLERWLAGPQRLVPGTKMPFGGIPDPERRRAVVNYLMSLR
ncbi:MAG TPA: c-type cytochrome [Novosphingobium sp.]|nr:c-type cytochrome [Novosphingobium sp.]HMP57277.1 c-type cytochrome [Novosphingobium sp.]